jgi:stalled ribosome rescue protein Dom34
MGHVTIWIDHEHTYIFNYTAKGIEEKNLKNEGPDDKEHLKKFYHSVANSLGSPDQLLIVGPGTAKDEFKHHCEDHHQALKKVIVGSEVMKSHPRKSEILAVSRKFFDHHFAWHNSDI